MDEDRNKDPRERLHDILAEDDDEDISLQPKPQPELLPSIEPKAQPKPSTESEESPLSKLPRMKQAAQTPPSTDTKDSLQKSKVPVSPVSLGKLPERKPVEQPKDEPAKQKDITIVTRQETQTMSRREKLLRALWTIASVISMTANVIVVIILLLALWLFRGYKIPEGIDIMVLNNLLSGLYSNFELMDAATISASIPVEDQIPVQFDLELKQPTTVTLSEDVTINGAYVVINTAVIDISAPAVVTLPAGTNLPILLDLVVPVDKQVPVNLNVAVDIPLNETELHTPFVGLQDVVKPLYCLVEPAAASSLTGAQVCK